MKLKTIAMSFAVTAAALGLPVQAQSHQSGHAGHGSQSAQDHSAHQSGQAGGGQAGSGQAAAMVDAEVRKVDREAQKVTLRHGPIPNLDMAGMTMVFRVANASMLESVKTGDKVRFAAERVGGDLTVTRLEQAK